MANARAGDVAKAVTLCNFVAKNSHKDSKMQSEYEDVGNWCKRGKYIKKASDQIILDTQVVYAIVDRQFLNLPSRNGVYG